MDKKEKKETKSGVYVDSVIYGFFRTLAGMDMIFSKAQSK